MHEKRIRNGAGSGRVSKGDYMVFSLVIEKRHLVTLFYKQQFLLHLPFPDNVLAPGKSPGLEPLTECIIILRRNGMKKIEELPEVHGN